MYFTNYLPLKRKSTILIIYSMSTTLLLKSSQCTLGCFVIILYQENCNDDDDNNVDWKSTLPCYKSVFAVLTLQTLNYESWNLPHHGLNEDLFSFSNHQSNFRKWLNSFQIDRKKISFLKNNSQHLCFEKKAKGRKFCWETVFTTDEWNLTDGGVVCAEVWVLSFLWQTFQQTLHIFPRHVDFSC